MNAPASFEVVEHQSFELLDDAPASADGFEYISLSDLDSNPPPEREWIVRDWLPRGTLVLMSGGAGIGKTLLAQQ
ncbi:MAG: AAA family ATPase, partial [Burkholderiales bacterium]|nr:AAA family ATPase [Burkholderiales bacterium]